MLSQRCYAKGRGIVTAFGGGTARRRFNDFTYRAVAGQRALA
jgi:hypothetical protein